jgi:hypothetical protein
VGTWQPPSGGLVRYGLANDSRAMNDRIKSSDLIGVQPVTIESRHVGTVIGRFVAREVKRPGWSYTATVREQAQLRFLALVASLGGSAAFTSGGYPNG